jgi:tetratricopeptide (TPR) repeat protein
MSESNTNQTIQGAADGSEAKIHVGTGRSGFFRRHMLLIIVIVVVVLGGLGGGLCAYRLSQRVTAADVNNVVSRADLSVKQAKGNPEAALSIYNHALSNAANDSVRIQLSMQAADLALNSNKLDAALRYALQADKLLHTADSSSLVASIYQQNNDTVDAVAYYKKAATEVPAVRPSGPGKQYYLDKAQAVSGAKQ